MPFIRATLLVRQPQPNQTDNCSVCDTTAQDPSKATQNIVLSRAQVTPVLITCGGCRREEGGGRKGEGEVKRNERSGVLGES